jgi:hypothetical protein
MCGRASLSSGSAVALQQLDHCRMHIGVRLQLAQRINALVTVGVPDALRRTAVGLRQQASARLAAGGEAEEPVTIRQPPLELGIGILSQGSGGDQRRCSCRSNSEQPKHYFKERRSADELHESLRLDSHCAIQLLSLGAVAGRFPFASDTLRSGVSVVLQAARIEHLQPRTRRQKWDISHTIL